MLKIIVELFKRSYETKKTPRSFAGMWLCLLPVLQYVVLEVLKKASLVNNELTLLNVSEKGRFGLELSPHKEAASQY